MYTLPMLPATNKEWLPMPRGINTDDSFADDLLQQFDKRFMSPSTTTSLNSNNRQVISESVIESIHESPLSITEPTNHQRQDEIHSIKNRGIVNNNKINHHDATQEEKEEEKRQRRSSAGYLLKRSSAFFKTTFDQTWKNLSSKHDSNKKEKRPISLTLDSTSTHLSLSSSSNSSSLSSNHTPTTIAINTTITIPLKKKPSQPSFALLQPPVITQYPPKPLKYTDISTTINNDLMNHRNNSQDDSLLFPLPPNDNNNNINNNNNNEQPLSSSSSSKSSSHKTLMKRLSMPALRKKVSSFALNTAYHNHNNTNSRPKSDVVL